MWVPILQRNFLAIVLQTFLLLGAVALQATVVPVSAARPNDNRVAAGELNQRVLTVHLELVEATWYPEHDDGPSLKVYGFSEAGRAPLIPGPLIRVPQGTEVRVDVRNTLSVAMYLRGLDGHGAASAEPLVLAAGSTVATHFVASTPGTYYYSARSMKQSIEDAGKLTIVDDLPMGEEPFGIESQLVGAIVVDPESGPPATAASDDRIFVITNWMAGLIKPPFREVLAINGKSWPYTERLSAQVGQTARWRLINTSLSDHAMHLHGFFFQVLSGGSQELDHVYAADEALHAVTQYLPPGTTALIAWTPERAGRWLLHCHMTGHMSPPGDISPFAKPESPSADAHSSMHGPADAIGMGSLVLGITVEPGPQPVVAQKSDAKARQLQLLVRERPATRFSLARMGYLIQEADAKDTADAPPIPGAPLVLTRGETVEIKVVNQLKESTAVHWHGIELESYFDGVPGWSGDALHTTPPIAPGESFVARMTPPRAGTFIYHTHWHDVGQLTSGLYGPLIVMEPGQKYDPETDKIFVIAREGPDESQSPLVLNGASQPQPTVLKLGTKYRLRFINIGTNDSDATVSLIANAKPAMWRAAAKDGWTLPVALATTRPASQRVTVGETYDFEFVPEQAGDLTLRIALPFLRTELSQLIIVR